MKQRTLESQLPAARSGYPIIAITGPRQSGKTTLARRVFDDFQYELLENEDVRARAAADPVGFLRSFRGPGMIIDEAQRAPQLFSYLQGVVDEPGFDKTYVLTGSQNFLLLESISQSLAGRAAIFHLLPFTYSEILDEKDLLAPWKNPSPRPSERSLDEVLFTGSFPRIHDLGLEPQGWLRNYYRTYLERDVRSITNVGDINSFSRFVSLCAGRSGQVLDLSKLGSDAGISQPTARRWLSILEASFQIFLLRPYHRNFNKRLIKRPKLYFLDTGLLCYLLRIRTADELNLHSARGAIFETFIVAEYFKKLHHHNLDPDIYFWRDSNRNEVDLILDYLPSKTAIEIKAGQTVAKDHFKGLDLWRRLDTSHRSILYYGGDQSFPFGDHSVVPWSTL